MRNFTKYKIYRTQRNPMVKKTKKGKKRVCTMSASERKAWGARMQALRKAKGKGKKASTPKHHRKTHTNPKSLLVGRALSLEYRDPNGKAFTHPFQNEPPVTFQEKTGHLQIPAQYDSKTGIEDTSSIKEEKNPKKSILPGRDITIQDAIGIVKVEMKEKKGLKLSSQTLKFLRKEAKTFKKLNKSHTWWNVLQHLRKQLGI